MYLQLIAETLLKASECYQAAGWENRLAMTDIVDISSSDSDVEIDDSRGTSAVRRLPNSLSAPGRNSNFRGLVGQSRNVASPKYGASSSNGSSHSVNGHTRVQQQIHPHFSDDAGPSNQFIGRPHDSKFHIDVNSYQQRPANTPRKANFSGNAHENSSSQQALKRILPSSLLSSTISTESNRSSNQIRDTYASSRYSTGPSSTISKGHMRDHSSMGNDNDVFMHENNGGRTLPSSMMHLKSTAPTQFATSSESVYRSMTGEERVAESDERLIYQAALEDLNQPKVEANLPEGLLSVSLLRHQKIALAWMLQKETRSLHCLGGILADDQGLGKTISMIALIQMQRFLQKKSKSEESCSQKTVALDIDDDDDGKVGPEEVKKTEQSDDVKLAPEVSTSSRVFNKRRPDAGTLVVCPASVLRQWARELEEKVASEAVLNVLVYHGGNRTKDPVCLASYDVVVTTYAIVTNEVPKQPLVDEDDDEKNGLSSEFSTNKRKKKTSNVGKKGRKGRKGIDSSTVDYDCGPLARVGWLRVILDEAQTIKNHRTQVARACCSLRAKRRWCLSGTPIQNTIDDLYSYFRFLRYDPYAMYKSFCNTIKVPISRNAVQGYKKLQAVLRAIMLRRTKGTCIDGEPIINLPPKNVCLSKVDFSSEERAFYTQLEADSRSQFKAYAAAGTVNQNYANILLMLLRLRQACDHPILVKEYNSDCVGKDSVDMARRLPRDLLINLLNLLESLALCSKCDDTPENPVVTMCGHVFCYQCISEYLTGDDNTCPATECKEQVGSDVVFSKATLRSCISDDLDGSPVNYSFVDKTVVMQSDYNSSKIKAVIEILQSHSKPNNLDGEPCGSVSVGCNGSSSLANEFANSSHSHVDVLKHTTTYSNKPIEGPIKTIIFSQWTSMLDLVEDSLKQARIRYRRLDGTMSLVSRDKGVKDFNSNPEVTVMLMSLKAGNLGLNMVAACHVILLDLWWNPTTEDQAVDRAHRIGQTRPVTVTRLTIKNTVEDRILALQEEKRKMVASAFGEDHSGGSGARLTVEDLKYLFMV
ncbi:helicase-like transcription factor CHR28 isoform X1 [Cannabis sativa]|uniref:helicase-like transcription factor CHR28 isoform X1 n=2 Tax=Cannabis sativa TaxID=3483 RepID=UPI0029C9C41B|nr:helicase-like transcription factor CHR28 isoform X1 [Cannabis sativa]